MAQTALRGARFVVLVISLLMVVGVLSVRNFCFAGSQKWIELRSPNFIVVTNAGEGQARRTAYQFEMIRAVFRAYFGQKQESVEQPVIILAAKDENALKYLLPEFWARKGAAHPVGIYLGATDADYIVLRLDVSLNQAANEPFEPMYHEYVHYLTRHLISRLPLWMVEGLAEFYGNTRIESKQALVGAPSSMNVALLREKQLLPISTLFEVNASSPYYHEESKTSIFYAESWALTHYLITRDWREKTHRVNDFVALLGEGVDQKEAGGRTIGDLVSLEPVLQKYIQRFLFTAEALELPKIEESTFQTREMSDAEALAVRADFMAHDHHDTEARQMLEEALKADPKLGIARDGLSFLALQQGNAGEGEKWSSQALALDPHDYRANYYYAWSLLKSGRVDQESLAKAEASLRVVMNGNPEFAPAYDAMAYVLSLEGRKERLDEAYTMTLQAVGREPGNVHYRVRAAEVLEGQQRPEDAVKVATLAVSMAKTPEEQQEASAALAGAQAFQESWSKYQAQQASLAAGGKVDSGGVLPKTGALNVIRQVNISAGVVILSRTQGVDFNSYLNREVMPKIQREWAVQIQKVSAEAGAKQGRVLIEFVIDRDGSAADIKLKQSTQEQELDDAVRGAIQSASPFAPLPEKFRGKNIALRFQCDYNLGEQAGSTTAGQGAATGGKKEVDDKSTNRLTTNRTAETPIPARASTAASPRSAHRSTLSITPPFADVAVGAKQQFTAANLPAGKKVIWKVSGAGCSGASCGTITPDGLYTAPVKTPSSAAVTVTAASADASGGAAFALVNILPSSTK